MRRRRTTTNAAIATVAMTSPAMPMNTVDTTPSAAMAPRAPRIGRCSRPRRRRRRSRGSRAGSCRRPEQIGDDAGGGLGSPDLQRGAAVVDGDGEGEELTAALFGADETGEVADVDARRRTRSASRRPRWRGAPGPRSNTRSQSASRSGIAPGSSVQTSESSSGLAPSITGAGAAGAAVAATQAQSSPHGPSTGSPLSCSAAACSWTVNALQLDQLASGRTDLGGDQLMEAPLHRAALFTVPDRDQIGDLLQRAAELLRPGDERQPSQRRGRRTPGSRRRFGVAGSTRPMPS